MKFKAYRNGLVLLCEAIEAQLKGQGTNILFLKGQLGAGKTHLVKELVKHLGGNSDEVDSPTFSLVNTYSFNEVTVHHFDLYRLETEEEIEDIGLMEYLESGAYCFIEWPEKIAEFFHPNQVVTIDISVPSDGWREYTMS